MLMSDMAVATFIANCVGVVLLECMCGMMFRLVFVFFHEPALSLTSKPNISHRLRPSLDELLNNGRKSLLYETYG